MKILGRLARRHPALCAVIVATLALGIGSATALYSVVNAVLVRPFPFRDQSRLVAIWQSDVTRNHPFVEVSYLDARDWKTRAAAAFESIASMSSVNFATTLTGAGDPQQLQVRIVSDPFFTLLGTPPLLGRTLRADDHRFGTPPVVVLGFGVWQRIFGGDPGVIGRSVTLDQQATTIVGVMPRGFSYPDEAELWAPVEQAVGPKALENRGLYWMVAVGRLQPGVSAEQARAALDVTITAMTKEFMPKMPEPFRAVVRPLVGELLGTTRQALLLLLCAVGAVLLIACANVSNLLLARSVDRRREIATRTMLGASRARLAGHLIAEVLPLSIAGGGFRHGHRVLSVESLVRVAGAELPRADEIHLDGTALLVAGVLSIGAGLLCALAPLLQTREVALASAFRDDARAGTGRLQRRVRDVLVSAEIALALVLLVGAALVVTSFFALRSQDLGFAQNNVLTVEVSLGPPKYPNAEQVRIAQRGLVERLRTIPGVQSASAVQLRPLWSAVGYDGLYLLEGQRAEDVRANPVINVECAMPGYFATMGIRMIAGRDFTEYDDMKSPGVIIVSESLARAAWPGQDPVGKRLSMNMPSSPFDDELLTVVGVVADVRYREIQNARLDLYQPYGQSTSFVRDFVMKTASDPTTIAADVRRVVREIDPNQPVELLTMDRIVATAMGRWRLNARLFGALAILAVLLSAVGTYSVMSYAVSRRTQEIGVRIALGAGGGDITRMVLGDGLRLAIAGLAAGIFIAYAVTGFLRHLLVGVGPHHIGIFAAATSMLCLIAIVACLIPARRAATVDPMVAMRAE
jgi:putative ABC transport system permease protein